ncbi:hypothetical protein LIER_41702 [Lithospermum erythrorhizon]|uniref:Uncharacterized protein n=1 Tax=Lithospermum erythrorhizon TaxID=34254 RepID=A0AAV3RGT4_LITER
MDNTKKKKKRKQDSVPDAIGSGSKTAANKKKKQKQNNEDSVTDVSDSMQIEKEEAHQKDSRLRPKMSKLIFVEKATSHCEAIADKLYKDVVERNSST